MHNDYMQLAIDEAKKGAGNTFTNPLVGAVIVKDDQVIAKGAHLEYGKEHAERNAVNQCQSPEKLANSTIYVTLEPCNHFGKQPPCSQLVVDSGIKKVVIGQLDPNPLVAGQGKAFLEEHGIEVITGVEEEQARQLNPYYNFFFQHQRPYIALKQATTLDGRIAVNDETQTHITSKEVWQRTHEERSQFQGILVGSQTILTDNPKLLALDNSKFPPIRMVLDRRARVFTKPDLNIFKDGSAPVWIFTEKLHHAELPPHVTVIQLSELSITNVVEELANRNLQSLYVEGGGQIHDAFLSSNYWDELITYLSPKIIGGNSLASFYSTRKATQLIELHSTEIEKIGDDFRISGRK